MSRGDFVLILVRSNLAEGSPGGKTSPRFCVLILYFVIWFSYDCDTERMLINSLMVQLC